MKTRGHLNERVKMPSLEGKKQNRQLIMINSRLKRPFISEILTGLFIIVSWVILYALFIVI